MPESWLDHKNRNTLDDRFDNLRQASPTQNSGNRKLQKNSSSGFKGVSWHKRRQKWAANIGINKKPVHIGYFDTPEEAALAYKKKAKEVFGEFCHVPDASDRLTKFRGEE